MRTLTSSTDLLAGGFLLCFASSLGQTWFIALAAGPVRVELGLSHGAFGGLYSAATLASRVTLMWIGAKVDRATPRRFALGLALAIGLAALGMALVRHPLMLVLVFFALRLSGQALLTHLAMTTLARSFAATRGRALSIASLGLPASEALLPALVVLALASLGWRATWATAGVAALGVLPPLLWWLLCRAEAAPIATPEAGHTSDGPGRMKLLLSPRFALLLPTLLAPAFIVTAVFFHQQALIATKPWPAGWFAACIPIYAACSVVATLLAGLLVDRLGAKRLFPLFLLPLAAATAMLGTIGSPQAALVAMALVGLSTGSSNTVITAALAEIYGTAHMGAIRALAASGGVIASSLSPGLFGLAFDLGAPVETALLACTALALVAVPLAARGMVDAPLPVSPR